MIKQIYKLFSLFLCFLLCFEQSGFAQMAVELNIASHLSALHNSLVTDKFRPVHLRYLQYDSQANNFQLLLDKGDSLSPSKGNFPPSVGDIFRQSSNEAKNRKVSPVERKESVLEQEDNLKEETKTLLNYFLIGLTLPNDTFWVNLRPDSPGNIIDDNLAQTDIGKIMLETDLQLKKDTASFTSPQTIEGREYWDKLYKKAEELYGTENVTIPTLTRPWIVPGEIIIREAVDNGSQVTGHTSQVNPSAYIYKATLKVMLEEDYLTSGGDIFRQSVNEVSNRKLSPVTSSYSFPDEHAKALNEYSTQLIRELIIPKLTKEVNSSKRYASLRQVYYSLIMAQWFKSRAATGGDIFRQSSNEASNRKVSPVIKLLNSQSLTNLTSKQEWNKGTYFNAYKKSFTEGEYNIQEPVYTPTGQVIRSYFSGGEQLTAASSIMKIIPATGSSALFQNADLIKFPIASLTGETITEASASPVEASISNSAIEDAINSIIEKQKSIHKYSAVDKDFLSEFSLLKWGYPDSVEKYAKELADFIRTQIGKAELNSEEWSICSVPSAVNNASGLLSNNISNILGKLGRVKLNTGGVLISGARLKSIAERKRLTYGTTSITPGYSAKGKKIILVDDVIVTGVSLSESVRTLLQDGAKEVRIFTLLNIDNEDLSLENRINKIALNECQDLLIKALNNDGIITSTTLKELISVREADPNRFNKFIEALNQAARDNLLDAALRYSNQGNMREPEGFLGQILDIDGFIDTVGYYSTNQETSASPAQQAASSLVAPLIKDIPAIVFRRTELVYGHIDRLLEILVRGNDVFRYKAAQALQIYLTTGLITKEEIIAKGISLDKTLGDLESENSMERLTYAQTIRILIDTDLVSKGEVKARGISLEATLDGLKSGDISDRLQSAQTIQILLDAELISNIKEIAKDISFDETLEYLKSENSSRRRASVQTLQILFAIGLVSKKDVIARGISLDETLKGLKSENVNERLDSAQTIQILLDTELVNKAEVIAKGIPLDETLQGLKSKISWVLLANTLTIQILLDAELVNKAEVIAKGIPLDETLIGLKSKNSWGRLASAQTLQIFFATGLVSNIEEIAKHISLDETLKGLESENQSERLASAQTLQIFLDLKLVSNIEEIAKHISLDEMLKRELEVEYSANFLRSVQILQIYLATGFVSRTDIVSPKAPAIMKYIRSQQFDREIFFMLGSYVLTHKKLREFDEVLSVMQQQRYLPLFLKGLMRIEGEDSVCREIFEDPTPLKLLTLFQTTYSSLFEDFLPEDMDARANVLLRAITRFDTSKHLRKDTTFEAIYERYLADYKAGGIKPLDPRLQGLSWTGENAFVVVTRRPQGISSQAKEYWDNVFAPAIKSAIVNLREAAETHSILYTQALTSLLRGIEDTIPRMRQEVQDADGRSKVELEKTLGALERVRTLLSTSQSGAFPLLSLDADCLKALKRVKEAHALVRQMLVTYGLQKNESYRNDFTKAMQKEALDYETMDKAVSFVNSFIKPHLLQDMPKEARVALLFFLSPRAFEIEIKRQDQGEGYFQRRIGVRIGRGWLGEFVGYFADECWTGTDNIMRDNLDMIALYLIDEDTGELLGGTYLIPNIVAGKPVLIDRGFSPRIEVTAGLSMDSLMEQIGRVEQEIARRLGAVSVLAVMRELQMGLGSNNPDVQYYYEKMRSAKLPRDQSPVTLEIPNYFNGHDITTNACVHWLDVPAESQAASSPVSPADASESSLVPSTIPNIERNNGDGSIKRTDSKVSSPIGDNPVAGSAEVTERNDIKEKLRECIKEASAKVRNRNNPDGSMAIDIKRVLETLRFNADLYRELAMQVVMAEYDSEVSNSDTRYRDEKLGKIWGLLDRISRGEVESGQDILLYVNYEGDIEGVAVFTVESSNKAILYDFGVIKNKQGTGIGTFLLDAFFDEVIKLNVASVIIPANREGKGFFLKYLERRGFPEREFAENNITVQPSTGWYNLTIPIKVIVVMMASVGTRAGSPIGGIDFRFLPIVTQAMTNLSANLNDSSLRGQSLSMLNSMDIEEEWRQIEQVSSSGISLSTQRIKEFVQACCLKGKNASRVVALISKILRKQEQSCEPTDLTLLDILVVFESIQNPQALKEIFLSKPA